MLMSGGKRIARVRYMDGTLRLLTDGDHVLCAVTGEPIALHDVKYWSVAKQEAYLDAAASLKGFGRK